MLHRSPPDSRILRTRLLDSRQHALSVHLRRRPVHFAPSSVPSADGEPAGRVFRHRSVQIEVGDSATERIVGGAWLAVDFSRPIRCARERGDSTTARGSRACSRRQLQRRSQSASCLSSCLVGRRCISKKRDRMAVCLIGSTPGSIPKSVGSGAGLGSHRSEPMT